jgi:23S rRNA (adenine-N6)-dimethyltransferase
MRLQKPIKLRNSIRYSQNFLKEKGLIEQLVGNSSLTNDDTVFEIGSGKGIITGVLSSCCRSVTAIETDPSLVGELKRKFQTASNVQVQQADFLTYSLPLTSYKVFSNIPFNITADIIRKLLSAPNPPDDSYLIVQQEAASKFAGAPFGKETLFSVLIKPWYELAITYNFKRSDFMPEPNVNIVLLQIKKRPNPLIITNESQQYKDFVVFAFNRSNPNLKKGLQHIFTSTQLTQIARNLRFEPSITPTKLTFDQWLGLFQAFVALVDSRKKQIVSGSEAKMRKEQSELDKVHRTRASKNWKSEGLI